MVQWNFWSQSGSTAPRPIHAPAPLPSRQEEKRKGSSTTFTLAAFAVLTLALAGKAYRSSKQARQAQYEARAWRKVSMAMIGRGRYAKHNHNVRGPRYGGLRNMESNSEGEAPSSEFRRRGAEVAAPPSFSNGAEQHVASMTSTSNEAPQQIPASAKDEVSTFPIHPIPFPRPSMDYSATHPHEDWDWKPADHPYRPHPWKRTRLPPWTLGFSSWPKASAAGAGEEEEQLWQADALKEDSAQEAKVKQEVRKAEMEEYLLRSAIWPDSDPLKASEASFIADEIFRECYLDTSAPPAAEKTKRPENPVGQGHEVNEQVRALESQVWALIARAQALEDQLRSRNSKIWS